MRTLTEIQAALAVSNVQEVARRSKVNAKTLYRITSKPDYKPSVVTAEKVSKALEAMEREAKRKPAKAEA